MEPISSGRQAPSPPSSPKGADQPPRTGVLAPLVPDAWKPTASTEGFASHVREAIASNRTRRTFYAAQSQGASQALSDAVIGLERLTLPFALQFDAQARRFQDAGIPIVAHDFVSMRGVRPPDTPPSHRNMAGKAEIRQLESWLGQYRKDVSRALDLRDFERVGALTDELLKRIEGLETSADAHFAMTRHVAESVGYAALHALDYRAQSGGETDELAARFIRLQAFGLTGTVAIDRKAQVLQHQGLGIIVNDLPHIPFQEEWQARKP
ncbi:MAG TPA: hypothetical protein V6D05_03350 [Stenomitos sp.]